MKDNSNPYVILYFPLIGKQQIRKKSLMAPLSMIDIPAAITTTTFIFSLFQTYRQAGVPVPRDFHTLAKCYLASTKLSYLRNVLLMSKPQIDSYFGNPYIALGPYAILDTLASNKFAVLRTLYQKQLPIPTYPLFSALYWQQFTQLTPIAFLPRTFRSGTNALFSLTATPAIRNTLDQSGYFNQHPFFSIFLSTCAAGSMSGLLMNGMETIAKRIVVTTNPQTFKAEPILSVHRESVRMHGYGYLFKGTGYTIGINVTAYLTLWMMMEVNSWLIETCAERANRQPPSP